MSPPGLRILLGLGSGSVSVGIFAFFSVRWILTSPVLLKFRIPTAPATKPLAQWNRKKITMAVYLVICLGIMLLMDFFTGTLLSFLLLGIWYGIEKGPVLKMKMELKKRESKLREVFPPALGMSVQALKTGQTVPQVLEYLSREAMAPLRGELAQVCREMDLGASAEEALTGMAGRFPGFSEFSQFLESYKISRQTGANLTHLLEVLLEGLEERNRLLRKMDAMTAQARLSGTVMGLLPFLLGLVFFLMDPSLITPLFTQKIGWLILLMSAVLETIGFLWIRQLLQLEV